METMGAGAEQQVGLRGERQIVQKKPSWFREVFGQLVTASFWRDLVKTIIHETARAFLQAFGGALIWYGEKKASPESNEIRNYGKPAQPQTPAAQAFSRGFSPSPEYRPSSYSAAPAPPPTDASFPGFGR